ncbi:ERMES complex subunit [Nowakowskiella sp. JEL0078]|nr:ERMES complex subunit [Nowakowskiella sp. JEL0078]
MKLRISNLNLRGIVVLVVDKQRGVTFVFKNDPLEKVDVNSTFDNIPNIRRYLQKQIEQQLRKLFQDDLPQHIHNLSLLKFSSKDELPTTVSHSEISGLPLNTSIDLDLEVGRLVSRKHFQKWIGNDVDGFSSEIDEDPNGYVLYRSLATNVFDQYDIGLRLLCEHKRESSVFEAKPGFFWPWLKEDEFDNEIQSKTVVAAIPLTFFRLAKSRSSETYDAKLDSEILSKNKTSIKTDNLQIDDENYEPQNHNSVLNAHRKYLSPASSAFTPAAIPPTPNTEVSKVVLRPGDNSVTAHLSNLLISNHTFYPHTRNIQHFIYRSSPPTKLTQQKHNQFHKIHQSPKTRNDYKRHSGQSSSTDSSTATTLVDQNNSQPELTTTTQSNVYLNKKKTGLRRMRIPTGIAKSGGKLSQTSSVASFESFGQKSKWKDSSSIRSVESLEGLS